MDEHERLSGITQFMVRIVSSLIEQEHNFN